MSHKNVQHRPVSRHRRQLAKLYRLALILKRTGRAEAYEERRQVRREVVG